VPRHGQHLALILLVEFSATAKGRDVITNSL